MSERRDGKMKIIRLLKRDMILGTLKYWFRYLTVVFVAVICSHFFSQMIADGLEAGSLYRSGTAMDYLLYITQGMEVFHFDPQQYFNIPVYWFVLQIGISYLVAYYPEKDFRDFGKKIFPAAGSGVKWWIAKCLWVVMSVLLYYIVLIFSTAGIAGFYGAQIQWSFSEEIMTAFFGNTLQYISARDAWLISIILPCLTTMALALVQTLCSFLLTPVVSFALMCGIYIASAYETVWFLPGNHTMWLRSSYVSFEGISPESGLALSVFLIAAAVFAGCVYFDNCDIF